MRIIPTVVMLAAATLSFAGTADGGPFATSVPFELNNGHIFVQAYVNGTGPYLFGFDTGASGMGRADRLLTDKLTLPLVDSADNSDGITVRKTDVVAVRRLRVGDLVKSNVRLLSRDYHQAERPPEKRFMGIIGRDFFADRVVTIDYRTRRIGFSRTWLKPGAPGVVAYGDGLTVPLCFAKTCVDAKVDTGSNRGLVLPEALARQLADSPPVKLGTVKRTNGTGSLYRLSYSTPMMVSGVHLDSGTALFVSPSTDTINIGSDFLKDYVLTIDQRHRLLRISPADARD